MTKACVVIGAGMVGTSTAWHLRRRGHEVVLIDRGEPGQATSFGNAGLVQREAAEPYPFPREWAKIWQVATGQGFDIVWRASALPHVLTRVLAYAWHSRSDRHARLSRSYGALIAACITEHEALVRSAGAQDLIDTGGYRKIFRTAAAFERAAQDAERLARAWGIDNRVEDGAVLAQREPGLQQSLAGAIHHASTWSVLDPGALVQRYAADFLAQGGQFLRAEVQALQPKAQGWSLRTSQGLVQAHEVVVAQGPWSQDLLKPLEYRFPMFVKRGYHQHYEGAHRLKGPVFDAQKGYLLVPMRAGLRLTTGAELALRDAAPQPTQLAQAEACARALVTLGRPSALPAWMGSRPCMPDMLPVMGPAPRHRGLWFNFGHGHQGFTLGPVAGRLLAEMVSGEPGFLDPAPYAATRLAS
ncbi:MAG: FAD-binding oxidoreductase [Betaproteobacteria bacterium]|nr:FAD-binding oxidoreductase [Betaproteobacteria bacterium]